LFRLVTYRLPDFPRNSGGALSNAVSPPSARKHDSTPIPQHQNYLYLSPDKTTKNAKQRGTSDQVTTSRFGIMVIADEASKSVYAQIPRVPDVAFKVGNEVTGILESALER
jgi:hypothetical protein